jgi:hypothetical protein
MFARAPLRISTELDVIPFTSTTPQADPSWLVYGFCGLGLQSHLPDA